MVTISPPAAIGGLAMRNVDPFAMMFDTPYGLSFIPTIGDMIDRTIGVLLNPPAPAQGSAREAGMQASVQQGFAFVAMAMDENDHQLVDVLEAIKEAAKDCGIAAERIDDTQSSERITDRIIESLQRAEFVIVDLTHERPNVHWEAGFAHALRKTPIYVARKGTAIHFDIKDYPIIEFRNLKDLKDGLRRRLMALSQRSAA
jgi:nucleoside 2-deoxyribosyltransferase